MISPIVALNPLLEVNRYSCYLKFARITFAAEGNIQLMTVPLDLKRFETVRLKLVYLCGKRICAWCSSQPSCPGLTKVHISIQEFLHVRTMYVILFICYQSGCLVVTAALLWRIQFCFQEVNMTILYFHSNVCRGSRRETLDRPAPLARSRWAMSPTIKPPHQCAIMMQQLSHSPRRRLHIPASGGR